MSETILAIVNYVDGLPWILRDTLLALSVVIEYIFPIFPGDTIIIAAGIFHAQGALSLWEIYSSIIIGTALGMVIDYMIGRAIISNKLPTFLTQRIVNPDNLKTVEKWYKKWGIFLLIINRFLPGVRAFFFIAAGMIKMPLTSVLLAGGLSALIFNSCLLALGLVTGYNLAQIDLLWGRYNAVAYSIMAIIFTGFIVSYYVKKRSK